MRGKEYYFICTQWSSPLKLRKNNPYFVSCSQARIHTLINYVSTSFQQQNIRSVSSDPGSYYTHYLYFLEIFVMNSQSLY